MEDPIHSQADATTPAEPQLVTDLQSRYANSPGVIEAPYAGVSGERVARLADTRLPLLDLLERRHGVLARSADPGFVFRVGVLRRGMRRGESGESGTAEQQVSRHGIGTQIISGPVAAGPIIAGSKRDSPGHVPAIEHHAVATTVADGASTEAPTAVFAQGVHVERASVARTDGPDTSSPGAKVQRTATDDKAATASDSGTLAGDSTHTVGNSAAAAGVAAAGVLAADGATGSQQVQPLQSSSSPPPQAHGAASHVPGSTSHLPASTSHLPGTAETPAIPEVVASAAPIAMSGLGRNLLHRHLAGFFPRRARITTEVPPPGSASSSGAIVGTAAMERSRKIDGSQKKLDGSQNTMVQRTYRKTGGIQGSDLKRTDPVFETARTIAAVQPSLALSQRNPIVARTAPGTEGPGAPVVEPSRNLLLSETRDPIVQRVAPVAEQRPTLLLSEPRTPQTDSQVTRVYPASSVISSQEGSESKGTASIVAPAQTHFAHGSASLQRVMSADETTGRSESRRATDLNDLITASNPGPIGAVTRAHRLSGDAVPMVLRASVTGGPPPVARAAGETTRSKAGSTAGALPADIVHVAIDGVSSNFAAPGPVIAQTNPLDESSVALKSHPIVEPDSHSRPKPGVQRTLRAHLPEVTPVVHAQRASRPATMTGSHAQALVLSPTETKSRSGAISSGPAPVIHSALSGMQRQFANAGVLPDFTSHVAPIRTSIVSPGPPLVHRSLLASFEARPDQHFPSLPHARPSLTAQVTQRFPDLIQRSPGVDARGSDSGTPTAISGMSTNSISTRSQPAPAGKPTASNASFGVVSPTFVADISEKVYELLLRRLTRERERFGR